MIERRHKHLPDCQSKFFNKLSLIFSKNTSTVFIALEPVSVCVYIECVFMFVCVCFVLSDLPGVGGVAVQCSCGLAAGGQEFCSH